ncbi:Dps family protein [Mucilaginibacter kameinonensis]|uniref:Dps family protein n=1 Tax=Mucilaginibacter kameinonensis TaxID=452286 RepID=UPI000EF77C33|nr:DNA starvation/stationary phase protection protein [Mucilaginibacter kameinonensis]
MKTQIGIDSADRGAVAEILGKLLADEFTLYLKTRNAHWNVEGPDFHTAHLFFEEHYNKLDETMDSTAERIRQIGHYAPATVKQFLQLTHLSEKLGQKNDSAGFMKELLEDHQSIIEFIRGNLDQVIEEYHDAGTNDFLTGMLREHEAMAWMLRAHL